MSRVLGCLAAMLTLCGCGTTISAPSFADRGNAICADAAARIARLAKPSGMNTRAAVAGGYVDAYAAEMRQELARLRGLGYPAGQRHALERIYRAIDQALAAAQRDPLSFRPSALAPIDGRLGAYGLTACRP
jgi:hypothetical protein